MGFVAGDHRVPVGAQVVKLKGCENCTRLFTTPNGAKYCAACVGRMLMPEKLVEDYKDAMPTGAKMEHSSLVPRYDDSMTGGIGSNLHSVVQRVVQRRRQRTVIKGWKVALFQAFEERGPLTSDEMADITRHRYANAAYTEAKKTFKLVPVASIWPPVRGKRARLYLPAAMAANFKLESLSE